MRAVGHISNSPLFNRAQGDRLSRSSGIKVKLRQLDLKVAQKAQKEIITDVISDIRMLQKDVEALNFEIRERQDLEFEKDGLKKIREYFNSVFDIAERCREIHNQIEGSKELAASLKKLNKRLAISVRSFSEEKTYENERMKLPERIKKINSSDNVQLVEKINDITEGYDSLIKRTEVTKSTRILEKIKNIKKEFLTAVVEKAAQAEKAAREASQKIFKKD